MYGSRDNPFDRAAGPSRQELILALRQAHQDNQRLKAELQLMQRRLNSAAQQRGPNTQMQRVNDALRTENNTLNSENKALKHKNNTLNVKNNALSDANNTLKQNNTALRAELEQIKHQQAEPQPPAEPQNNSKVLRLLADIENLRRRQSEAIDQAKRTTKAALVTEFVETLDAMEQALQASEDTESPWYQGSVGIKRQMESVLKRAGIERLGEVGERFDPHIHEAVGVCKNNTAPDGHIATLVRAGYTFASGQNALIRPARVIVSG